MLDKAKVIFLTAIAVMFSCVSCSNDEPTANYIIIDATGIEVENNDIATVKAFVYKNVIEEVESEPLEIASSVFENGKFSLFLPGVIPDKYLRSTSEHLEGITKSDINAKTGTISIEAFNSAGEYVGNFTAGLYSDGKKYYAEYSISDRNYTLKGDHKYGSIDCNFKKGINISYINICDNKFNVTTQKPSSENIKWCFGIFWLEY